MVTTHGNAPHLEAAIEAFAEHVRPHPVDLVCVADGPGRLPPVHPWRRHDGTWKIVQHGEQLGFCQTLLTAWTAAWEIGVDYVFWLENDFVIERDLDLRELAHVLAATPTLAQMALMRDAVNAEEKAAGGLYESRPGQYTSRTVWFDRFDGDPGDLATKHALYERPWLEHRAYFTTNPSLMSREFMLMNLAHYEGGECEGKFGIDLVSRGYRFGVWGNGEPWCRHVGERDGIGY